MLNFYGNNFFETKAIDWHFLNLLNLEKFEVPWIT